MSMESMWNKKSMKTMGTSLYTVNNNIARIEQFLLINVSFVCGVCHCPYLMVFNVLCAVLFIVYFFHFLNKKTKTYCLNCYFHTKKNCMRVCVCVYVALHCC